MCYLMATGITKQCYGKTTCQTSYDTLWQDRGDQHVDMTLNIHVMMSMYIYVQVTISTKKYYIHNGQ